MTSSEKDVSVYLVVPTYNGQDDMPGFFSSLSESLHNCPYTVTVVVMDNNSHDNTVMLARQLFPAVQVIQNHENKGYAGISIAMQYALEHNADYVAVLNQDLVFGKGWLSALVSYMNVHPSVGAAQSQILLEGEGEKINSAGNALHYLGFGYTLGHKQSASEYVAIRPFFYCSGAAVLFRAQALKRVGLFDEIFFLYHEDTDLSWRLRTAGYDLAVVSDSIVFHKYVFGKSALKFFYIERNRLLTLFKNYELHTLLLIAPMLIVVELAMLMHSLVSSITRAPMLGLFAKLRTYIFFLKKSTWNHIRNERKAIRSYRKKHDREIISYMVPDIVFQELASPLVRYIMNPMTRIYWAVIRRFI